MDKTIDSQEEIEEGMGDVIRLGALITLLTVPGIVDAKDFSKSKTSAQIASVLKTEKDSLLGGYTKIQAANIVARTLYDEARGEGEKGIDAVASVLYNRAGGKAEKLPGVCLKKYQFSKWNDQKNLDPNSYKVLIPTGASKPGKDREMWLYCQKTAGKLIFSEFKSTIGNLNSYYVHKQVTPGWSSDLQDKQVIGNHTFGYLPDQDGFKGKTQKPSIYQVKTGDSLSKIAKANNTTTEKMIELNPSLKKNPNKIFVGMKLKLPS